MNLRLRALRHDDEAAYRRGHDLAGLVEGPWLAVDVDGSSNRRVLNDFPARRGGHVGDAVDDGVASRRSWVA